MPADHRRSPCRHPLGQPLGHPVCSRRQLLRLAPAAAWPALLPAGLVLALTGCAGLGGPPVITLGEAELNALAGRHFPLQRRVMEVMEVEASAPRLRLLPERNRLAVALSLALRDRLSQSRQAGQLAFDSALRFEPADQSVRLLQVKVTSVLLDAMPAAAAASVPTAAAAPDNLAARLGRTLAERLLEDLPVWRLNAERQAQLKAAGLAPGAVTVTARGVEITLARAAA